VSSGLSGVRSDTKHSYRSLEHVAENVRQQLRYPVNQGINALRLFEDLHQISITLGGGRVVPLGYGVIRLEDSEGYTRYDPGKQKIEVLASERTYKMLENHHPRAGYFVGHELGHVVLHTDQLVRLAEMPSNQQAAFHRGHTDHKPYTDTEWQSNAFASAFLMPAVGLNQLEERFGHLTTTLLVSQFGVSVEAARYRIKLYQNRRNELLT
jgi:hypothetical protein